MDDKILTIEEVAEMLRKSVNTVRYYVQYRKIPFYRKNGSVFFIEKDIWDWVKSGLVEPNDGEGR